MTVYTHTQLDVRCRICSLWNRYEYIRTDELIICPMCNTEIAVWGKDDRAVPVIRRPTPDVEKELRERRTAQRENGPTYKGADKIHWWMFPERISQVAEVEGITLEAAEELIGGHYGWDDKRWRIAHRKDSRAKDISQRKKKLLNEFLKLTFDNVCPGCKKTITRAGTGGSNWNTDEWVCLRCWRKDIRVEHPGRLFASVPDELKLLLAGNRCGRCNKRIREVEEMKVLMIGERQEIVVCLECTEC